MKKRTLCGINIQFPISQLIVDGSKTIETRTYPIPDHYIGKEMILIETPGKNQKFQSRMTAIITFGECFKYKSAGDFYADTLRHQVNSKSPWAYDAKKGKWGWPILKVTPLAKPIVLTKKKGICFTKDIQIPLG